MYNILKRKLLVISTYIILIFIFIIFFNFGCKRNPSESPAFDLYKKAVTSYDSGIYSEALALTEQAIKKDDKLAVAWTLRGECLLKLGKTDEALKSFNKAIEIEPHDFIVLTAKGSLLDDTGKREEALKVFDDALSVKPDYAPAWFYKARALARLGKREDAIGAYKKAIENNIDMVEVYTNLGILLIDTQRYDEAYSIYDEMMEKYPNIKGLALYCKASVSAMKGDKKLMLEQMRECLKMEPSYKDYIMTDNLFSKFWEDKDLINIATSK